MSLNPVQYAAKSLKRANLFQVELTFDGNTIGPLHVVTFTPPNFTIEPIEIPYGDRPFKIMGKNSWEDVSMTILDSLSKNEEALLRAWFEKFHSNSTGMSTVADQTSLYGSAEVEEYNPKGLLLRKWTLKDIFPTAIDFGELSRDSKDKKQISLTLACNEAWLD